MSDDQSHIQILPLATPGAGANASRRIPGEFYETLYAARFKLVASAAVANRFVSLDYLDGDNNILARIPSTTAVTAGQTTFFTFGIGLSLSLSGAVGEQLLPLLEVMYPPGCKFQVTVGAIDVADQISAGFLTICRVPSQHWEQSRGSTPDLP